MNNSQKLKASFEDLYIELNDRMVESLEGKVISDDDYVKFHTAIGHAFRFFDDLDSQY